MEFSLEKMKRSRINFTRKEKMDLLSILKEYPILTNKTVNVSHTRKKKAWEEVTVRYNNMNNHLVLRTSAQLKKLWENSRTLYKGGKLIAQKQNLSEGGNLLEDSLSALMEDADKVITADLSASELYSEYDVDNVQIDDHPSPNKQVITYVHQLSNGHDLHEICIPDEDSIETKLENSNEDEVAYFQSRVSELNKLNIELKAQLNLLEKLYKEQQVEGKKHIMEIAKLNSQLDIEKQKVRISNFILGLRSALKYYEATYFPKWLLKNEISLTLRWRVMFAHKDHQFVQIFKSRLEKSRITVEDFINSLDQLHDNMYSEYHRGAAALTFKEEEWEEIFDVLKISDYNDQQCLKIISAGIKKHEHDLTFRLYQSPSMEDGPALLYMKGIPADYSKERLKRCIDAAQQSVVTDIVMEEKSKGEAFIFIRSRQDAIEIYKMVL